LEIAYLGLGANLGDARASIELARAKLAERGVFVRRRAAMYRTAPVGPAGQPDYLNTAVEVETSLSARDLLAACKAIERDLGRTPSVRWGPRVIDLDILLYGEMVMAKPDLTIPHPELHRRRFALAPLFDLAPDRIVPGLGRTVRELYLGLDKASEVVRL
jgi:2-amino-4-hydroxy-6-hydroxymethyldihydropteridine diphosphokinase